MRLSAIILSTLVLFGYFRETQAFQLSLDQIVRAGLSQTDSAKVIRSKKDLADSLQLQAEAPFDWNFESQAKFSDNRNQPSSPFSPNSIKSTGLSLGLNKLMSTGTRFDLKVEGSKNNLTFPPASNTTVPEYFESVATLGISQNLLSDAFGTASRKVFESTYKTSAATALQAEQSLADYAVSIIQQFYSAWLAQQNLLAAERNLETKNRLYKSAQIKSRLGTGEKTEYLQAESAKLIAETSYVNAEESLNRVWRELIIRLKFDEQYLKVPAKSVSLVFNDLNYDLEQECAASHRQLEDTNQAKIANLELEASELESKAVSSKTLPELTLNMFLASNGVRSELSDSQKDATSVKTPHWNVSLVFKKSLENNLNKSTLAQSKIKLLQKQSDRNLVIDNLKVNFSQLCAEAKNLKMNSEKLKSVLAKQAERSKLESERFRVGRSRVLDVIQAADDASSAELNYKQSVAQLQLTAWQILNANNKIQKHVNSWVGEMKNE